MVPRGCQPRAKARGYKDKQGKCQDLPPIYHLAYGTALSFILFPFGPNHYQFRERYDRCSEPMAGRLEVIAGPEVGFSEVAM
jgi:hypothetical protein